MYANKVKSVYKAQLKPSSVLVYFYLEDRMNKRRECWPSFNTIANDLGICKMTAIRAVYELKSKGFITVKNRRRINGGNTSNLYKLTDKD